MFFFTLLFGPPLLSDCFGHALDQLVWGKRFPTVFLYPMSLSSWSGNLAMDASAERA